MKGSGIKNITIGQDIIEEDFMEKEFQLKDRNVVEMITGELLLYVEDVDMYVGLNNDTLITDSYIVFENVYRVFRDYTLSEIIY